MFGLGLSELVVIILIILVLINPKDLPKIARKIGQWARKFQEAKSKFDDEMRKVEQEIHQPLNNAKKNIDDEVKHTAESVTIRQTLPDLQTIMPSRGMPPLERKEEAKEETDKEEKEEMETKVYTGGTNDRSN